MIPSIQSGMPSSSDEPAPSELRPVEPATVVVGTSGGGAVAVSANVGLGLSVEVPVEAVLPLGPTVGVDEVVGSEVVGSEVVGTEVVGASVVGEEDVGDCVTSTVGVFQQKQFTAVFPMTPSRRRCERQPVS